MENRLTDSIIAVISFNLLNYAFGITSVSIRDYIFGSVGMIPGTILYVYIGSLVGDIALIDTKSQPNDPILQWTVRAIGLLATIVVTLYITRIARKALDEQIVE